MSSAIPTQLKFSNLLHPNPEIYFYGFDLHTSTNLQNGNILLQKIRRKSLNLGCIDSKREIGVFNSDNQKNQAKEIINKSKINRLLLQAKFQKQYGLSNEKKKKLYVIRKRQQKNKITQNSQKCPQHKQKTKNDFFSESYRSNTEPTENIKGRDIFKIKRKIPKFGIQDIVPRIRQKKCSLSITKTTGFFMSTSSNNFYNSSFYLSSKIRESQQAREDNRPKKNDFCPEIKTIIPNTFDNQSVLVKKKQKKRFHCTNSNGFWFKRSKTEQFENNDVCGWQKDDIQENDNQNYI